MNVTIETSRIPLDTLLSEAPIAPAKALRHALRIAAALRSSHEGGRVFGALDPSRIELGPDEATVVTASTAFTPYAAPEFLAGAKADVRSDVFAFGAILYYMLSGRQPFPGRTPEEVLEAAGMGRPAPLAIALPGLDALIFQCLDLNPAGRWQNMRLICFELRLLCAAAGRLQPAPAARRSAHTELREHVARLEQALAAREAASEQI